MYISSKYNIKYKNFIYNLISKNYLELNNELLNYLNSTNIIDDDLPKNIKEIMIRNNIIVDYDELQYIDYRYNSLKFDNKKASFIIYPTLTCNFSCNYCFETVKTGTFGDNEVNILIKYLLLISMQVSNKIKCF